jgi:transcriptional regulator with XRE-family HTH domain
MQTGRPSKRPRPAFGQRLHQLRETAGLTQAQVAEKLGISARAYAFWEREPVALRPDQLQKLADTLGISVEELIGTNGTKKRGSGPVGKARRVFEEVSKLPRSQQQKIVEVVEALVAQNKAA